MSLARRRKKTISIVMPEEITVIRQCRVVEACLRNVNIGSVVKCALTLGLETGEGILVNIRQDKKCRVVR